MIKPMPCAEAGRLFFLGRSSNVPSKQESTLRHVIVDCKVYSLQREVTSDVKVYISVDMEGVAGVVSWAQVTPGQPEYTHAREWMIEEANAAVSGALDAGATEVIVNDAHNGMRNLLANALHPKARLVSGGLKDNAMMAGLDATFQAAMFVGYHGRGGGYGVLAHTWSSQTIGVRLNGVEVGEWGLNALMAGEYGVPIVMVTGDDCVAREVQQGLAGPVETVVVKRALTKYAAESLPRDEATKAIRAGAAQGIAKIASIPPFRLEAPIALEVDFTGTHLADSAAMLPRAERPGPLTVKYSAVDGFETFRAFLSFMALARYAD